MSKTYVDIVYDVEKTIVTTKTTQVPGVYVKFTEGDLARLYAILETPNWDRYPAEDYADEDGPGEFLAIKTPEEGMPVKRLHTSRTYLANVLLQAANDHHLNIQADLAY